MPRINIAGNISRTHFQTAEHFHLQCFFLYITSSYSVVRWSFWRTTCWHRL